MELIYSTGLCGSKVEKNRGIIHEVSHHTIITVLSVLPIELDIDLILCSL